MAGERAVGKRLGLLGAGLGMLLGAGCFSPSAESLARIEEIKAEGDQLFVAVESVETRMLGNQANLMLWTELRRRHGQVAEIACENHTSHFNEMVKKFEQNEQKVRNMRRRRMAQAGSPAGEATVVSTTARVSTKRRNN